MGVSFFGSAMRYDDNFMCRQMAYLLKKTFEEVTGEAVSFDGDTEEREGSPVISLCDDATLARGEWRIEVQGNTIICRARSPTGTAAFSSSTSYPIALA